MPTDESLELFPTPERSRTTGPSGDAAPSPNAPLAERMRPRTLDEVVGQASLVAPGAPLRVLADRSALPSMILWGPPGCGKTTLAGLLATHSGADLESLSAVTAGVKEIRDVVERARRSGRRPLLFLDEIHRLNRAQQDALLPHVERGRITLVGATTENPSFEVIAPLLSRCRVFVLERLDVDALVALVERAARDPQRGLGGHPPLPKDCAEALAAQADGDARRALGLLETAAAIHCESAGDEAPLTLDAVRHAAGARTLVHDRDRDEHYHLASAFIKSLRASDPDAALYYAARLLAAGDDPFFVARRLVIFASEDIGNADPSALGVAMSAHLALERLGMPEGRIPLAQAITHLACAAKSNAAYRALGRAFAAVEQHASLPVPLHLRNAPTGLARALGHGRDYENPHDAEDAFVARENLPEALAGSVFYEPGGHGAEAEIRERVESRRRRRAEGS